MGTAVAGTLTSSISLLSVLRGLGVESPSLVTTVGRGHGVDVLRWWAGRYGGTLSE
jgi:hypothetical protein